MKKILFVFSFLILGMGLLNAVAIQGNAPEIQIESVIYTNHAGDILINPYYSWENILITATISDQDGWSDVINPDLVFNGNKLNCDRTEILSTNSARYLCSLTILPSMVGEYELHLYAIDKGGLFDDEIIGKYYFNPKITLTYDSIVFNGNLVAGQIVITDWINVDINSPLNIENPIGVVLYGKNLYEDVSNCASENICTRYEMSCYEETRYLDRTKRVCNKVPYEREYKKRVCSYVNGKRVCKIETYSRTMYKTVCETIHYQQPIVRDICEETTNCLSWRTVKRCGTLNICGQSNVMDLDNFEYIVEGTSNWKQVQVEPHKEVIFQGDGSSNFKIKFRVNIPSPCYGNYVLDGRNLFIKLH